MTIWDRDLERLFWDPWRELNRLRRGFGALMGSLPEDRGAAFPAVNVHANNEKVLVSAEIPGLDPGKLEITVKDKVLSLRGLREPDAASEDERYLRRERGYGSFTRIVQLPFAVDPEKVDARYVNGILTVTAERSEAEKPKKITVKTS